jgi:hypothetical protein
MGMTFQGWGSICWRRCLCVYVSMFIDLAYVRVSHLFENVNMATHLVDKFATVFKHLKPILLPS